MMGVVVVMVTLVHEAKLSIQEEFTKKEKDHEVQERMARSSEIGTKCAMVARGQNYPQLLQKLIVQGLIKIEEMEVTVYCRSADKATVAKVLSAAVKQYVEIMLKESGIKLNPIVKINENSARDIDDSTYGGVILTAINGKIVCDNTMAARLKLVYDELLPAIRAIIFPEEE
eukprot:scaffold20005_cov55-Attheya_sp.AAC.10